jgi:hypothetical protein
MMSTNALEIYKQYIKLLPAEERLRLLALMARDLASETSQIGHGADRSIMELRGLGKHIWEGVDAEDYVNGLRAEWSYDRTAYEA